MVSFKPASESKCQRPTDQHTQLEPAVCAETRLVACHAVSFNKYSPMFRQIAVSSKRRYLFENSTGLNNPQDLSLQIKLWLPSVFVSSIRSFRTHGLHCTLTNATVYWYRGSSVVKLLCYKSEGRWFDPSWGQISLI